MNRRIRSWAAVIAVLAVLVLLLALGERSIALAQRLVTLPVWLQWAVAALLALFLGAALWLLWRLFGPRDRPSRERAPVNREAIEQRIAHLDTQGASTTALTGELRELDRRKASGGLHVAVFGEISTGKSSLIAALANEAATATDVIGGTTRSVSHHNGRLSDERALQLADVPGSEEPDDHVRESLAREEVLRAHAVLYVCAGDLNRNQGKALEWLAEFGKPVLLVLNKADQWSDDERAALLERLREHAASLHAEVVAVSAGGQERFERVLADGRTEQVQRSRVAQIEPLLEALERLTRGGAETLEPRRESSLLTALDQRTGTLEAATRAAEAERIVARYTRRAIVGALAAVAPGSDLIIQGALATALTRALARNYDVAVSDLELERFLKHTRVTVRTSASVVLAIAGNALKAFPGLGTLGGGVLHAFAYALIFDSLGKALAATFAQHQALDAERTQATLKTLLQQRNRTRLKQLAALTVDTVREERTEESRP